MYYFFCVRCVSSVPGYQSLVAALLSAERDRSQTAVDVEAARLTAQKLAENGIKGLLEFVFIDTCLPVNCILLLTAAGSRRRQGWE